MDKENPPIQTTGEEFAAPVDSVPEAQQEGGVNIPLYEDRPAAEQVSTPADLQAAEERFTEPAPAAPQEDAETSGIQLNRRAKAAAALGAAVLATAALGIAGKFDVDNERQQTHDTGAHIQQK